MTKKRHHTLITIIILLIAFGLFYCWGAFYYQRDRQIDRIVSALDNPAQGLARYVTATNPDVAVTDQKLKPLQEYFAENKNAAKQVSANLRNGKDVQQLALKESGTYFLIFPKYTLEVPVFHPQVESNHPKSTLVMNQQNLGQMDGADQNFYQDLGFVFPGRYHLKVATTVAGRKLKADSVVNIWSSKTISMVIKTGTFQIRSVPNGVVYINDRKVKTLDKYGQATFKNYPLAKNTELFIKTKYHGKTIRSEKVKDLSSSISSEFSNSDDDVTDYGTPESYAGNQKQDVYQDVEGDYIVNPLWPGLIDKQEAAKLLKKSYLKADEQDFVAGKKTKSFQALKKEEQKFKKDKKKVELTVKVTKIMPAGDYASDVSYQLVYNFRQNGKKKKQVMTYEGAVFHQDRDAQLIVDLGKKIK